MILPSTQISSAEMPDFVGIEIAVFGRVFQAGTLSTSNSTSGINMFFMYILIEACVAGSFAGRVWQHN
jgi:hypothetical protein